MTGTKHNLTIAANGRCPMMPVGKIFATGLTSGQDFLQYHHDRTTPTGRADLTMTAEAGNHGNESRSGLDANVIPNAPKCPSEENVSQREGKRMSLNILKRAMRHGWKRVGRREITTNDCEKLIIIDLQRAHGRTIQCYFEVGVWQWVECGTGTFERWIYETFV